MVYYLDLIQIILSRLELRKGKEDKCTYLIFYTGVTHACNAFFVVDTQYLHPTTITDDIKMQRMLTDFWVSFATNE